MSQRVLLRDNFSFNTCHFCSWTVNLSFMKAISCSILYRKPMYLLKTVNIGVVSLSFIVYMKYFNNTIKKLIRRLECVFCWKPKLIILRLRFIWISMDNKSLCKLFHISCTILHSQKRCSIVSMYSEQNWHRLEFESLHLYRYLFVGISL